jgi:hypothetical protein
MNQTGVYGVGSPRQARRNGELGRGWADWGWVGCVVGWVTQRVYRTGCSAPATRRLRSTEILLVYAKIGTSPAM